MAADPPVNIEQVVPFLGVDDMERSLSFYRDGLGFAIGPRWIDDAKLRWCWLSRGGAALMLQEFWKEGRHAGRPEGELGRGLSLVFMCGDTLALYAEWRRKGIDASEPQVLNHLWTIALTDSDGYKLHFESPTEVDELTRLSDLDAPRPVKTPEG